MSLPPELRVLCLQLSQTPVADLPSSTPTLLRNLLRCHVPLSNEATTSVKADGSASSVLVHKLKTQLSTLLNGKSSEGRFTAVVLVKAAVEVGGWEVLRGAEPWVRGLLSVLGRPDPSATKELSIIALTKIYCMTHPYQTLVRELTTPTLPTFVSACLNLISAKSSSKSLDTSSSLLGTIFESLAMLIPRHTTIFRPFVPRVLLATRKYLAPTSSDVTYVPPSLKHSARRLVACLHQTVAKGAGGEEWGKAVRGLIKDVHVTADIVFRAVIEDWETSTGYVAQPVDFNQESSGGGRIAEDLPQWRGLSAGAERLTGLLETLSAYLAEETSTPVSIPLSLVMDMVTRMLSISVPSTSDSASVKGDARLHPAVDREERDCLWSALPQVQVAALQLVVVLTRRLEYGFLSLAQATLDQLAWVFPSGRHNAEFRHVSYVVTSQSLLLVGQGLSKAQTGKLATIVKACCKDLQSGSSQSLMSPAKDREPQEGQGNTHSHQNPDMLLRNIVLTSASSSNPLSSKFIAASTELLPLFVSHLPPRFLDISLRSLIERTAILTHNKQAMIACVLHPFVGKNGRATATILPHITQEFAQEAITEILLRPRMPLVPATAASYAAPSNDDTVLQPEDEDMEMITEDYPVQSNSSSDIPSHPSTAVGAPGLHSITDKDDTPHGNLAVFGTSLPPSTSLEFQQPLTLNEDSANQQHHWQPTFDERTNSAVMAPLEEDSDDESVHLTMQLDTDSEGE